MKNAARPTTPRGQATINKILDSTLEFIQRDGIACLTTNHIAKESGVKVGSIYHFFPNKEAILLELIKRWQTQIQTGVRVYLNEVEKDTPLSKLTIDLTLRSLEDEYEYSAAFNEIAVIGSIQPVLVDLFNEHLEKVANMIADHYMNNPNRPEGAKKNLTIEFSLFLHPMLSEGLSVIAGKKGRARERHIRWYTTLIESSVSAFEESMN